MVEKNKRKQSKKMVCPLSVQKRLARFKTHKRQPLYEALDELLKEKELKK